MADAFNDIYAADLGIVLSKTAVNIANALEYQRQYRPFCAKKPGHVDAYQLVVAFNDFVRHYSVHRPKAEELYLFIEKL